MCFFGFQMYNIKVKISNVFVFFGIVQFDVSSQFFSLQLQKQKAPTIADALLLLLEEYYCLIIRIDWALSP
jgi:hypothetical protein